MKYITLFIFSIALLASCTSSSSDVGHNSTDTTSEVKVIHMTPQEFQAKMNELGNEQLVDVRTAPEIANGYIDGSHKIDYKGEKFGEMVALLDKSKPVMVYCAGGGRSKRACNSMKDWGFTEIYELDNGFSSWESAGLPVKK